MVEIDNAFGINWRVFAPNATPPTAGGEAPLERAVREGRDRLDGFLASAPHLRSDGARPRVLILMNDGQRATDSLAALRALRTPLLSHGPTPRLTALVATGAHPPSDTERERAAAIFANADIPVDDIAVHDANNRSTHTRISDFNFNRLIAPPCAVLAIGSVEPHYFAGLTGAHKTATIGVLSRADITANHAEATSRDAAALKLIGNPVFAGIERALITLRGAGVNVLGLNLVQVGDQIVDAALGDPLDLLEALRPRVVDAFCASVAQTVDLVWLRVPPPLGMSLYQADKALQNNAGIVKDGGAILLEAACPAGVGPDRFVRLMGEAATYAAVKAQIARDGYQLGDHKALRLRRLTDPAQRGLRIAVVGDGLSVDVARDAGMRAFRAHGQALDWLTAGASPQESLRIEDAGNFVAALR